MYIYIKTIVLIIGFIIGIILIIKVGKLLFKLLIIFILLLIGYYFLTHGNFDLKGFRKEYFNKENIEKVKEIGNNVKNGIQKNILTGNTKKQINETVNGIKNQLNEEVKEIKNNKELNENVKKYGDKIKDQLINNVIK